MAQDVNSVTVIGRLTKDVGSDERSFKYIGNGIAVATVDIAVNRTRKQGDQYIEEVSYFSVMLWGKTAENLKPYLTKGKQICVRGFLKQERWEKDGQKQSRVVIVSEQCQLLGSKSDSNNSEPTSSYAQEYQNQQNTSQYEQVQQNPFAQNQSTYAQQYARQNQPQNQQNGFVQEDLPYEDSDIPF